MAIERRFLGWHRPALHLAADFLYEEFAASGAWDMDNVLVVLPGARAGRRLRELIAIKAASMGANGQTKHCLLLPPRIITAGDLPEALYEPQMPIATGLETLMAWADALQALERRHLNTLFPRARIAGDPASRLALAAEVAALDQELSAECVSCYTLAEHCRRTGSEKGEVRWRAFDQLARLFDQSLAQNGRTSLRSAREAALRSARLAAHRTVVLVGTADLPAIAQRMLETARSRAIALIHATPDLAPGFDEIGRLVTEYWHDAHIPIASAQIEIVDYPRDQAQRVGELASRLEGIPDHVIAVSLAEEALAAPIERAIERSGRAARRATGTRLSASAPTQLLSALAAYLSENRAQDFAALLRHPDLTDWLARELAPDEASVPWLDLCDRYLADHLPVTIVPGPKLLAALDRAARAIRDLIGIDPRERYPVAAWAERIAAVLAKIYPHDDAEDSVNHPALALLLAALSDLARLAAPSFSPLPPGEGPGVRASPLLRSGGGVGGGGHSSSRFSQRDSGLGGEGSVASRLADEGVAEAGLGSSTLAEAIGLLLATSSSQTLPAPAGAGQVELIGWLEAHLDDSPVLFLTGFNEGAVPQSLPADAFLTDSERNAAGLVDNRRRYARDAYLFRAIIESRQIVRVVCGRFGVGNEPLAPSRLLLACEPEEVVQRLLAFYGEREPPHSSLPTQIDAQKHPLASIPRPRRTAKSLGRLRVTAFRDYLQCPYRFYLKHVLGLDTLDDTLVEMRPDSFGDILHKVLQEFGRWVLKDLSGRPPEDADAIERFLLERLSALANERFGEPMHPAVAVQVELLAQRLKAFARFQAADSRACWTIHSVEQTVAAEISVDGIAFLVEGRFDRIDYNRESGRYRILDYKSGDSGADPEKIHRDGDSWIDLQLPLYRRIAPVIDIPAESVEVGFITLPKDLQKVAWIAAPWDDDEFEEAYFKADEIIRKVRAQEFWPPSANPPTFDDGLAAICLDTALDRDSIIGSDGPEAYWPLGEEATNGA